MKLYVIRHAQAGSRASWDGPDAHRPLSPKGRRQAAAIAAQCAGLGITRLVSSPAVRCTQTLEPLGAHLGLAIDDDLRLQEGASCADAIALANELRTEPHAAAICTHGDIVPEMLRALRGAGTRFTDPLTWPKASTWVLVLRGERWAKARYLPPPSL